MQKVRTIRPKSLLYRQAVKAMLLFAAWSSFGFSGPEIDEYEAKAMFLIHFIKYVDWSSHENDSAVRIGVLGKSEIVTALKKIAEYKRCNSKPLEILQVNPKNLMPCNIIFVARTETNQLPLLAKEFSGKGVLLVSEDNKSASHLAGINLMKANNKIKFEINQASIKQSGLRLSNQLQLLAAEINP